MWLNSLSCFFTPLFTKLVCSVSTHPRCPCTLHSSNADCNCRNSSPESVTFQAPRFSRILSWFLEPGIGTTLGYLWSIHASDIWALVAFFSTANRCSKSSIGRLASIFSFDSWGTNFRTSSKPNCSCAVTLPERNPLAIGENGTTPIPFQGTPGKSPFRNRVPPSNRCSGRQTKE